MYAFLKGNLISIHPSHIIVEVQGIGYMLHISCRDIGQLPPLRSSILLFTVFVVRELSQALYGFLEEQEKEIFELLLNISGVGPKLALSLIGHLSLKQMQQAVNGPDLSTLCKVPGVGKKTAERLVVELKDKLNSFSPIDPSHLAIALPETSTSKQIQDAMSALINLGYHQNLAQKAVKQTLQDLPEEKDLALLITTSLKYLQKI